MRKAFHVQLAEAEGTAAEMAGHAIVQLKRTLDAMRTRDDALADRVVDGDDVIDELYQDLERRILTLLATQAPVASDLRLVSALLHVNIALERIGDLCTNIAKNVKLVKDLPQSPSMQAVLEEMGRRAAREIDAAMQAFGKRDVELALMVSGMDETVSRLNRSMIEEVAAVIHDEERLRWAMRMFLVSRWLERIGDHAVDIAEEVAFLVTGERREFTDSSHKADQ